MCQFHKKMFRSITLGLQFLIIFQCFRNAYMVRECIPRSYNQSSIVCVCNSTYCDDYEKIKALPSGNYVVYTTTMSGKRFEKQAGVLKPIQSSWPPGYFDRIFNFFEAKAFLKIQRDKKFQKIHGFGIAFTDSSGMNLLKLSKATRKNILKSYFDKTGIECNLCRVPIGGTDFSNHTYAYNMMPENDMKLSNFSLTKEDLRYKIPFIKKANKLATSELRLICSTWSPPTWMKLNNDYWGISRLFSSYYQTYADYHIRFLEEYEKTGISFWGITTGNEPIVGLAPIKLNSLGWLPEEQGKWIEENFGPTIKNSKFKNISIVVYDDVRHGIVHWLTMMYNAVPGSMKYIDGIGLHWYSDHFSPPKMLDQIQKMFPDKFFLMTEASTTAFLYDNYQRMKIGSWDRVTYSMELMIENFQHSMASWIDWNFALDLGGGPSWNGNSIEAPIMVIPEKDEFIKLPFFYVLGHFSKFIPRGSYRISAELLNNDIEHLAFLRPDNGVVVIIHNPTFIEKILTIQEDGRGFFNITIPSCSVQTVVYW